MLPLPQQRVLARFLEKRRLKSHPDYWGKHDTLPIRALLAKGLIAYELGPYRDDYYFLLPAGAKALGLVG